jgi:hypothetical protein
VSQGSYAAPGRRLQEGADYGGEAGGVKASQGSQGKTTQGAAGRALPGRGYEAGTAVSSTTSAPSAPSALEVPTTMVSPSLRLKVVSMRCRLS